MKKSLILTFILLLFACALAEAVPARRSAVDGFMTDGSSVRAVLHGDENFHYYVSETDGALLMRQGDAFVYADVADDGSLKAATAAVDVRKRAAALNASKPQSRPRRIPGLVPGTTFPAQGSQKIAVVLVQYQDVKFNLPNPADYFTRMLNQEGFSDYWATGSARDWYINSSFGQFTPEFIVMGPVTLQKPQAFYGANDAFGQDTAPQKMVYEACRTLNPDVDFSQFDCDGDGMIDNVFVVYAGRGEASGGGSDCVWPHAWTLASAEPGQIYTYDGVRLNRYACCNEWELSDLGRGFRPVGIGTFVHEFSHVMGLPDLYSTNYAEGNFTVNSWSVMDYGSYNNDACTPPQFSAWERSALGYATPKLLPCEPANISLRTVENNEAYMIPTPNPNEYFVLEHRRQTGWDTYIPGHGMLVWHIDYDSEVWRTNSLNNDNAHNHVDIIEADNIKSATTTAGDCFPGTADVTALSFYTTPAMADWQRRDTGYALSGITELTADEPRLLFRVNGGVCDIAMPAEVRIDTVAPASFTVAWAPTDSVRGYWLSLFDADTVLISCDYIAGNISAHNFGGLTPSTDYFFTIKADDGAYGSAVAEPSKVTTAPPTFDYFAPEALAATDICPDSFTANWSPLADATEYYVQLYHRQASEKEVQTETFDNGVETLPEGWSTTSSNSYGMASYSGVAAPSLRLSVNDDKLIIAKPGNTLSTLSFWHRGNGTTETENLKIEGRTADGDWTLLSQSPVTTEKGGRILEITFEDFKWAQVAITFVRATKGAVAIDDVVASFNHPVDVECDRYAVSADTTSLTIASLTPGEVYKYEVSATDGTYLSRVSERIEVAMPEVSAVESPAISSPWRIDGNQIITPEPVRIFDICGRCIASGKGIVSIPTPGVYIVEAAELSRAKILLTGN